MGGYSPPTLLFDPGQFALTYGRDIILQVKIVILCWNPYVVKGMRRSLSPLLLAVAIVPILVAACGSTAPTATPTPTPTAKASLDTDLEAILGTTVLRPGTQRVAFILTSPKALITVPEVTVSTFFVADSASSDRPRETTKANFNLWPYGTRGSYTTELSFDRPGTWRLEMEVDISDEVVGKAQLLVDVTDGFDVVDIGSQAPVSMNRILQDVSGLEELSSAYEPDPDLYSITIADALSRGQPTMVVFATPAFCTAPTCGPQVETVHELKEQYQDRASFIHVEVYDNPHEVQGDLNRARISPVVEEWGLTSIPHWTNESWVFVMDRDGRVSARFEAYSAASELEEALLAVLD